MGDRIAFIMSLFNEYSLTDYIQIFNHFILTWILISPWFIFKTLTLICSMIEAVIFSISHSKSINLSNVISQKKKIKKKKMFKWFDQLNGINREKKITNLFKKWRVSKLHKMMRKRKKVQWMICFKC